jgi:two-component system sensor histidine kinase KdpD
VRDIIDAGIKVIGTVNVQYVEELAPQVEAITGKHITETLPMAFIKGADEIEIVDAPPDRVDHRLARLRELALLLAADVVDYQLNEYLERNGMPQDFGTHERILVCLTPRANFQEMLDNAQATARGFHGDVLVAYVHQDGLSDADQSSLGTRLAVADAAGVRTMMLEGRDPAETLLNFARTQGVTQLFVGHTQRSGFARLRRSPLDKLISEGHGMDVRIFPQ